MSKLNLPQVLIISRGLIYYKEKFLFIKRHNNDSYAPGMWELPGGKLDADETIEQNLIRECYEETNMKLTPIKIDIATINEIGEAGKYKGVLAITILGLLAAESEKLKLSFEHSEHKWIKIEESENLELTPATNMLIKKLNSDTYLTTLLKAAKDLSFPSK